MENSILMPIKSLNPHGKNARRHPEEQVKAIANSIKEWGWTVPILVDEDFTVLAGHGRLEAAKKLGLSEAPVIVASGWTEEQKRAYIIADNQLSDSSDWDSDILMGELTDLSEAGWDLSLVGFDDEFLAVKGSPDIIANLPSINDPFPIPKTSVLSSRLGDWKDRREGWMGLGISSELGRDECLTFSKSLQTAAMYDAKASYEAMVGRKVTMAEFIEANPHLKLAASTSIFDPVLCEACYRWFCPEGGTILDPFAGGSVRGIVASLLGYRYIGQDLREEQVVANRKQAKDIVPDSYTHPKWIVGDSRNIRKTAKGVKADMVFSCPPYANLEVYSDDPNDLSTLGYSEFREAYSQIISESCSMLKPGGYAVFVVGEVRSSSGDYLGFVPDSMRFFSESGLVFENHIILVTPANSLPTRAGKPFDVTRKIGKTHQNVLVFRKL